MLEDRTCTDIKIRVIQIQIFELVNCNFLNSDYTVDKNTFLKEKDCHLNVTPVTGSKDQGSPRMPGKTSWYLKQNKNLILSVKATRNTCVRTHKHSAYAGTLTGRLDSVLITKLSKTLAYHLKKVTISRMLD